MSEFLGITVAFGFWFAVYLGWKKLENQTPKENSCLCGVDYYSSDCKIHNKEDKSPQSKGVLVAPISHRNGDNDFCELCGQEKEEHPYLNFFSDGDNIDFRLECKKFKRAK